MCRPALASPTVGSPMRATLARGILSVVRSITIDIADIRITDIPETNVEPMTTATDTAMLHATLHTVVCADVDGNTQFLVDRPSDHVSSCGHPEISRVGEELDGVLAALVAKLDARVPELR